MLIPMDDLSTCGLSSQYLSKKDQIGSGNQIIFSSLSSNINGSKRIWRMCIIGCVCSKKYFIYFRLFIALGVIWVMLTLGLQGLYVWAFDFPKMELFRKTGYRYMIFHFILSNLVDFRCAICNKC